MNRWCCLAAGHVQVKRISRRPLCLWSGILSAQRGCWWVLLMAQRLRGQRGAGVRPDAFEVVLGGWQPEQIPPAAHSMSIGRPPPREQDSN